MNFSYMRDMSHNYLIPELKAAIRDDDYRVRMLLENNIRGLLPCVVRNRNGENMFYYDITSRQPMTHIYGKNSMDESDIRTFLRGLFRTLEELKKYLLDAGMLVLEPQMIYMDIETREPAFCYLPGHHGDIAGAFRELTAYLLENLCQRDRQAVLLGYEIYREAREENYCLEAILKKADHERQGAGTQNGYRQGSAAPLPGQMRERGERYFADAYHDAQTWRRLPELHDRTEERVPRPAERQESRYGRTVREEPLCGETRKPYREKKKKQEKRKDGPAEEAKPKGGAKKKHKERTGAPVVIVCLVLTAVLAIAAAWLWGLSTTQIGGVVFLLTGALGYGITIDRKQKKKQQEADEFPEETDSAERVYEEQPYLNEALEEEAYEETAQGYSEKMYLGDTGVLYETGRERLMLVGTNPGSRERILLEDDMYVIGQLKSQADIVLNHPSVSRVHAKIQREGSAYYLIDLNSTNGTFLNGRRLDVHEKVMIQFGDEIAFARVGFYVGREY